MDVRRAAKVGAMVVRQGATSAALIAIAVTQRVPVPREAMVRDRVAAATANRAKVAKTTMSVRGARASIARDARKASVATAAKSSATAGLRNRSNRDRLVKRSSASPRKIPSKSMPHWLSRTFHQYLRGPRRVPTNSARAAAADVAVVAVAVAIVPSARRAHRRHP
jgi:hypothetical protein